MSYMLLSPDTFSRIGKCALFNAFRGAASFSIKYLLRGFGYNGSSSLSMSSYGATNGVLGRVPFSCLCTRHLSKSSEDSVNLSLNTFISASCVCLICSNAVGGNGIPRYWEGVGGIDGAPESDVCTNPCCAVDLGVAVRVAPGDAASPAGLNAASTNHGEVARAVSITVLGSSSASLHIPLLISK